MTRHPPPLLEHAVIPGERLRRRGLWLAHRADPGGPAPEASLHTAGILADERAAAIFPEVRRRATAAGVRAARQALANRSDGDDAGHR